MFERKIPALRITTEDESFVQDWERSWASSRNLGCFWSRKMLEIHTDSPAPVVPASPLL